MALRLAYRRRQFTQNKSGRPKAARLVLTDS
jgi:hypothetical protein